MRAVFTAPFTNCTWLIGTSLTDIAIQPIRIDFGFDFQGHPIAIDPVSVIPQIERSPLFEPAEFPDGFTQFSDAVQRANFYSSAPANWHTLLNDPQILAPITVHVPPAQSLVFRTSSGSLLAFVDTDYFESQVFQSLPYKTLRVEQLLVLETQNVFLLDFASGFSSCCLVGFHGAIPFQNSGGQSRVFTFAYATWIDSDVAGIVFSPAVADVQPLSHEIIEWIDDPFTSNIVPHWQFPGFPCDSFFETHLLEVADPVENYSSPIQLDGFTYHLTNVALLPWFSREPPVITFGNAYSFPNPALLTTPSPVCRP
jgi:hypothetical protein